MYKMLYKIRLKIFNQHDDLCKVRLIASKNLIFNYNGRREQFCSLEDNAYKTREVSERGYSVVARLHI